ncbi:outer membrane beta-barrel family protein [Epilithonimonas hungarica]|uniref:Outer membrane receptor proteins, mostly Fe transport n=1 Tax=Epilithonimonas hungarica TaxID=454006 RepID=A0A1G7G6S4_9FLAO|nr:outer membrane beta-barrel family protein [Epilithonimonas hungarica]SDE83820.1 Outer membrane receptor proteins, mostly Fe transport [Epilithonimonas hungarica]
MKVKSILPISALFLSQIYFAQETPKKETDDKEKQIEAVTITKTKKAVEQKADRTIYDFSEQPHLNSGNTLEGLQKIPGLVVSEVAGMVYQGKALDVYMDGRPLNIYSTQLTAYLEGLPANSIEKIEIITQPGAEFPATSGGAIINIVTSRNAKSYLSATYAGGYRFSNYEHFRSKFNNSLTLNSKNKWFGWQLNVGQSYNESETRSTIDEISRLYNDNYNRNQYLRSAFTFDVGQDRLLLNYNLTFGSSDRYVDGYSLFEGKESTSKDKTDQSNTRNEITATYQKNFDDKNKKLEFKGSYTNFNNNFGQASQDVSPLPSEMKNVLNNGSNQNVYNFRVDYSQPIKVLDEGKISLGAYYDQLELTAENFNVENLDYKSKTTAFYSEASATKGKMDLVLGLRGEYYNINGTSLNPDNGNYDNLRSFEKFKLFPNASVQYNIIPKIASFNINYNKKITLPNVANLNPNNNRYSNDNIDYSGNPNLQPTIFDNFEIKLTALNYAFIGYNFTNAKNQVVQKVSRTGDVISQTSDNIGRMKTHNFNIGFPIPLAVFNTPFKEIMKMDMNPDKVSFIFLYGAYQLQQIDEVIDPKGYWTYNVTGQFILPLSVKFIANYTYLTKGNSDFFYPNKSFYNTLNLSLSKKFNNDRMTLTLFANDVFNTNETNLRTINTIPNVFIRNKNDTRNFGLSFNYKIPTKNKLAKESPNLLNQEKKEETSTL